MIAAGGMPAQADEHMKLVDTIDVGGNGLGAFDISFVDPTIDLYVLSDRTNASVDFFDASDAMFTTRVPGFKGVVTTNGVVNNNLSGPDGVVIVDHKEVWAGDGDSTVKVIDIATSQIAYTIPTLGSFRTDEMSYDFAGSHRRGGEQCGHAALCQLDRYANVHGDRQDPIRRHKWHAERNQWPGAVAMVAENRAVLHLRAADRC